MIDGMVKKLKKSPTFVIVAIASLLIVGGTYSVLAPQRAGALSLELDLSLPRIVNEPLQQIIGGINERLGRQQPTAPTTTPTSQQSETFLVDEDENSNSASSGVLEPSASTEQPAFIQGEPVPKVENFHVNLGPSWPVINGSQDNNDEGVLGLSSLESPASAAPILEKSSQGWMFLGIPWYMWLICLVPLVAVIRMGYVRLASATARVDM
jgi:hypothetical protein